MSTPTLREAAQAPEGPSPELLRLHRAGDLLANCAFNIAQHAGDPISETVAATLKDCHREWDAACLAFKEARAKHVAALTQAADAGAAEPVATVASWTNGSYSRNYKLTWHKDVPEGAKLYTAPPAQQIAQVRAHALSEAYDLLFNVKGCKATRFDAQNAIRDLAAPADVHAWVELARAAASGTAQGDDQ